LTETSGDRLSIFEDFINHLDIGDAINKPGTDEDQPKPRKPKKS
jgi:hypothetical protein